MSPTSPRIGVRVRDAWLSDVVTAIARAGYCAATSDEEPHVTLWLAEDGRFDRTSAPSDADVIWLGDTADAAQDAARLSWPIEQPALVTMVRRCQARRLACTAVLDAVQTGVVVVDGRGLPLYRNQAWREMSGSSDEYSFDQSWLQNVHSDDRAAVRREIERIEAGGRGQPLRFRLVRGDGEIIWAEGSTRPLTSPDGRMVGQVVTVSDISHVVAAAAELQRVNAVLTTTLENAPTAVVVLTRAGVVTSWNRAAEEIFGWSAEEAVGLTLPYARPEDGDLLGAALEWLDTHQGVFAYDGVRTRRDGAQIDVRVRVAGLRGEDGKTASVVAVIADMTEQNAAARRLAESEDRYRIISLLSNDAAYSSAIRPDGGIEMEWATDGMYRLFGLGPDQMGFQAVLERIHPADVTMMTERYQMLCAGHDDICEYRVILPEGGLRWLRSYRHAERDGQGRAVRVYGAVQDITERRRLAGEIDRHRRQLRQLAAETVLAEERERRRIAIELHDRIGQSLTALKMRLARRAEPRELLAEADKAVGSLMQDVRLLTNELSPPVLYDLGFAAAVEWLAERYFTQHGLEVSVSGDWSEALAEDLQILLYQGLRELLFNVVKHADATHVEVLLVQDDATASITVRDNGRGFTMRNDDLVERDCFGLFSLRERMEHVGGQLRVDSSPGQGAAVSLILARRLG